MAHCVGSAWMFGGCAAGGSGVGSLPWFWLPSVGIAHWVGSACGAGREDWSSGWALLDSEEGSDMVPHVIRLIGAR